MGACRRKRGEALVVPQHHGIRIKKDEATNTFAMSSTCLTKGSDWKKTKAKPLIVHSNNADYLIINIILRTLGSLLYFLLKVSVDPEYCRWRHLIIIYHFIKPRDAQTMLKQDQ